MFVHNRLLFSQPCQPPVMRQRVHIVPKCAQLPAATPNRILLLQCSALALRFLWIIAPGQLQKCRELPPSQPGIRDLTGVDLAVTEIFPGVRFRTEFQPTFAVRRTPGFKSSPIRRRRSSCSYCFVSYQISDFQHNYS